MAQSGRANLTAVIIDNVTNMILMYHCPHSMSPGIHSNYACVFVTDVFEDLQNSFSTQKNLLFLVVVVNFNPFCCEFQAVPSILGLESSTPTGGLRQKNKKIPLTHTM